MTNSRSSNSFGICPRHDQGHHQCYDARCLEYKCRAGIQRSQIGTNRPWPCLTLALSSDTFALAFLGGRINIEAALETGLGSYFLVISFLSLLSLLLSSPA